MYSAKTSEPYMNAYNESRVLSGIVFDIQRFATHDGYGIRTLVFLKGCPLTCKWCSNPESQNQKPEIIFYEEKCIHCGACIRNCPFGEGLKDVWPDTLGLCTGCGRCVEECYAEARNLAGRLKRVDEVLDEVLKDRVFYEESGGGLTLGGGEPSFQADFATAILKGAREEKIHTAIETCGVAPWKELKKLLDHTDLLLFDLKHMDTRKHEEGTGVGNEIILQNARSAVEHVKEMILRIPLIPQYNNDSNNLHNLGSFIKNELERLKRVDLLPYHSIGESKSKRLGKKYPLSCVKQLSREEIIEAKLILQSYGLKVKIEG